MVRVALLALILCPAFASAERFPPKPSSNTWITDAADLLPADAQKKINTITFKLWKDERVPVYIVTIPSLLTQGADDSMTIERYAYNMFNTWGIGSQKRNYGMLLLVSPGDRKARIELGGGWSPKHDLMAAQIMEEQIVARFKEGDFPGGVVAGVAAMDKMARGMALPSPYLPPWVIFAWVAGIIACVLIGISLIKQGRTGWGWAFLAAAAMLLWFLIKALASAKANSSSSSGGFGGGSSSGGGATGSW